MEGAVPSMFGEIDNSPLNVREKYLVNKLCSEVIRAYREGMPVKEIKKGLNYFIHYIQFQLRLSRNKPTKYPSLPKHPGAVAPQPPTPPHEKPPSPPQDSLLKMQPKPTGPISARVEVMNELKMLWARRKKFLLVLE